MYSRRVTKERAWEQMCQAPASLQSTIHIYIFTRRKRNVGNRTDWDGLRWFSVLRWARVAVSNCCMLRGPWCSVTYGRWPKGMKIASHTPVTKQHVIFDVLLLTDLDPQNFIAGARSSNPYPGVRNLFFLWDESEMGWKQASLCADKMGWGEHSHEERILQEVFLNASSLLMPGQTPFLIRHLAWLLVPPFPTPPFRGAQPRRKFNLLGTRKSSHTAWWEEKGRVGNSQSNQVLFSLGCRFMLSLVLWFPCPGNVRFCCMLVQLQRADWSILFLLAFFAVSVLIDRYVNTAREEGLFTLDNLSKIESWVKLHTSYSATPAAELQKPLL